MDQVWNESGIIEVIKDIVHKTFDIDLSEKPDTIRVGEIGLDSMGLLDVIMSLEDTIGCKIKNIDLPKDPTLVEVAGMVIRNLPSEIHG
ncbi:acyl carrier protein [mine drainage metagenome]|jgi:acyl carrier protein|uniref:Acyl carrier protein n=1 Tax=mine drainage metagenome TaxID=410659 RepID=A0A1J5Q8N6_9ZZZZ